MIEFKCPTVAVECNALITWNNADPELLPELGVTGSARAYPSCHFECLVECDNNV